LLKSLPSIRILTLETAKIPNVFDTPSRVSGKSTFVPIADPVKTTAPELKIRDFEFSNPYSRAKKQEIWKAAREDD
jgi:hypothetical protein